MRKGLAAGVVVLAACSNAPQAGSTVPASSPSDGDGAGSPTTEIVTTTQPEGGFGFVPVAPAFGADGNRVAALPGPYGASPTTLRQLERPVVRVDMPADDALAIGYDNGELRILSNDATTVRQMAAPTGIIYTTGPNGVDVLQPLPGQAPLGRPAVTTDGQVVYTADNGDVVAWGGSELARAAADALPDGDVLFDADGRILVLTGPTERYGHGILGDVVEASGFVILAQPDLAVVGSGTVSEPDVIEGRRALWADFDGDGRREVQVTVSNAITGARLVVFEEDGSVAAESAAIGRGRRWRHQIAFGEFSVEPLGVEVVTPHIGGAVRFSEYGTEVGPVASTREYTSHAIGSRELDMAVAVDIDGDGLLELVLPTQDRRTLVAIGVAGSDAAVEWQAPVAAPITSNIAVATRNGVATIAVGTADGTVYMWTAVG